jgi:hypothetical protein
MDYLQHIRLLEYIRIIADMSKQRAIQPTTRSSFGAVFTAAQIMSDILKDSKGKPDALQIMVYQRSWKIADDSLQAAIHTALNPDLKNYATVLRTLLAGVR